MIEDLRSAQRDIEELNAALEIVSTGLASVATTASLTSRILQRLVVVGMVVVLVGGAVAVVRSWRRDRDE